MGLRLEGDGGTCRWLEAAEADAATIEVEAAEWLGGGAGLGGRCWRCCSLSLMARGTTEDAAQERSGPQGECWQSRWPACAHAPPPMNEILSRKGSAPRDPSSRSARALEDHSRPQTQWPN